MSFAGWGSRGSRSSLAGQCRYLQPCLVESALEVAERRLINLLGQYLKIVGER